MSDQYNHQNYNQHLNEDRGDVTLLPKYTDLSGEQSAYIPPQHHVSEPQVTHNVTSAPIQPMTHYSQPQVNVQPPPQYPHQQIQYAPQQPVYAPQQPQYAPQQPIQPIYAPQQPQYAPQQPVYAPQQPQYPPQQPQYATVQPQQPTYAPQPCPTQYPQAPYSPPQTNNTHTTNTIIVTGQAPVQPQPIIQQQPVIFVHQHHGQTDLYPTLDAMSAWIVFLLNFFLPGIGSIIVACLGAKNPGYWIIIGVFQLITAFILIGWIWALVVSCNLIGRSR